MVMPSLRILEHAEANLEEVCITNGTNNRAYILLTWNPYYTFRKKEINYMGQWDFWGGEQESNQKKLHSWQQI